MDGFYAGFLGAFIEELPTQFKVNFVNQVGRMAV
jgi:hypothetical protein